MLRDLPPPHSSTDQPYDIVMTAPFNPVVNEQNERPDVGTVDILDDIFGSVPPSPTLPPVSTEGATGDLSNDIFIDRPPEQREQHPSDVPRLRSTHVTNGYREGIAASKEKYLQEGFDEGYSLGAELGLQAGRCLGVLEGLVKAMSPVKSNDEIAAVGVYDREKVVEVLEQARQELKLERLCGRKWFGEDGVWTYDVPGQERAEEERVSFADVAAAHPVVKDWVGKVGEVMEALGLTRPS